MVDRFGWRYHGQERPPFAEIPGAGQESVWDYPRPPRLDRDARHVRVCLGDVVVAESSRAVRVCETASPPTFYLPPKDVNTELLRPAAGGSYCEWKGTAVYYTLRAGGRTVERAVWAYPRPLPAFDELAGHLSFYPAILECFVGDERVRPQPGGFYGGWVTSELTGPFKGEPGTAGW
jgi:uncharacterized protein (DUF427 family)